jgi:hypothetical protein
MFKFYKVFFADLTTKTYSSDEHARVNRLIDKQTLADKHARSVRNALVRVVVIDIRKSRERVIYERDEAAQRARESYEKRCSAASMS